LNRIWHVKNEKVATHDVEVSISDTDSKSYILFSPKLCSFIM